MASRVVLEGPLFEKLSMYGGVFGPSVIDAISKSPDVKSVAPNTWTELDSTIPTPIVGNATILDYETTQTNTWCEIRFVSSSDTSHRNLQGIIAGQNVGVARSANIIPVKAGDNEHVSQMGIINGLNFALQHAQAHGGRGVISISVSMFKNQPDNMLQVVQSVLAAGLHIVNSAGNGSTDRCAVRIGNDDGPGGRGPITVGNMDVDDSKAGSSNYGACLTVFAPGSWVPTTDHNNPNNFIQGFGTSEATAHTSGLVATLLSDRNRSPRAMKSKIICLAAKVPAIIGRLEDPRGTTTRLIQAPAR
ncbi:peptidase S8/S53 domain-containing protein [Mycena leptocephala]|nr:peptidase S8/S53 domain-containing protein [Mycena leptocephala]